MKDSEVAHEKGGIADNSPRPHADQHLVVKPYQAGPDETRGLAEVSTQMPQVVEGPLDPPPLTAPVRPGPEYPAAPRQQDANR